MSGEQRAGGSKPAPKSSFDAAEAPPVERPPPRARRMKPPPAVITAGGVDMARAHASGIRVRNNNSPDQPADEPRVVLAISTDPRKVPTQRRQLDRASSVTLPETAGASTPLSPDGHGASGTAAGKDPMPNWARALIVVVAVALVAGLARRARTWVTPPPPPPVVAMRVATPPLREPARTAPREPPATPPPATAPSAEPADPPKPAARVATAAHRARPTPVAPAKRGFTPPFELPGEKR